MTVGGTLNGSWTDGQTDRHTNGVPKDLVQAVNATASRSVVQWREVGG
jgi:hypothetical protein